MARRKTLKGDLDEPTHRAWHQFARSYGVNVAAFLEALGRRLGELEDRDVPESRLPAILRDAIREARDIEHERGRRA